MRILLLLLTFPLSSCLSGGRVGNPTGTAGCPLPVVTGPWEEHVDKGDYQVAVRRCAEKFPESPCLVRFRVLERGKKRYHAICGKGGRDVQ